MRKKEAKRFVMNWHAEWARVALGTVISCHLANASPEIASCEHWATTAILNQRRFEFGVTPADHSSPSPVTFS